MRLKKTYKKAIWAIGLIMMVLVGGVLIYFWDQKNVTIFDAKKLGIQCQIARKCNGIVGINCLSEVDGPYYYVDSNTNILSKCGGYCQGGCTNCPPDGRTCDNN